MSTTLNGIDISKWQNGLDLSKIKCDFVIVKATEGIGYVDPCCDAFYQQAKKLGKKLGFYHFARPTNDAVKEAQFFYNNTKNYFGEAIPVLDWEAENKHDTAWAKRWLDEVYRLSGVRPMIYMSESVVNSYNWSAVANANYGLWVAKYRDNNPDYNYDMSNAGNKPSIQWWSFYAIWQWTSSGRLDGYNGNLDCDVFYGNKTAWNAYVKGSAKVPSDTSSDDKKPVPDTSVKKKTLDELAQEVLNGKWKNGSERERMLTDAYKKGEIAYSYAQIQKRVNELLAKKDTSAIKVGDTVTVTDPINYDTGKRFTLWYKNYTVLQLNGKRAVIGVHGIVTSAINVKYLKKV